MAIKITLHKLIKLISVNKYLKIGFLIFFPFNILEVYTYLHK